MTSQVSGMATANGIEICYETFGNPSDPAVLLVMGFTAQLNGWHEDFCKMLVNHGRYVIRFDNRDCGLSTHLDGVKVDLAGVVHAWENGGPMPPIPYTMSDFSNDAFGLLSFLGIERAHIVGASMGGMIVQTMAIEHPERVVTMTSIMSTTGELAFYQWNADARQALLTPPPPGHEAAIAHSVSVSKILSNNRYFDPVRAAERGRRHTIGRFTRKGLFAKPRQSAAAAIAPTGCGTYVYLP